MTQFIGGRISERDLSRLLQINIIAENFRVRTSQWEKKEATKITFLSTTNFTKREKAALYIFIE